MARRKSNEVVATFHWLKTALFFVTVARIQMRVASLNIGLFKPEHGYCHVHPKLKGMSIYHQSPYQTSLWCHGLSEGELINQSVLGEPRGSPQYVWLVGLARIGSMIFTLGSIWSQSTLLINTSNSPKPILSDKPIDRYIHMYKDQTSWIYIYTYGTIYVCGASPNHKIGYMTYVYLPSIYLTIHIYIYIHICIYIFIYIYINM